MALTVTALASASNPSNATTLSSGAVLAAAAVGSLVVVAVGGPVATPTFSVADSKTNTWQGSATILSTSMGKSTVFWSVITTALVSGTDTITLSTGGISSRYVLRATRFDTPSGTSATVKDVETSGSGTTGTAMSAGPTASTTNANDAVLGIFFSPGTGNTFTVGTGYTLTPGTNPATTQIVNWQEYQEVVATGTQTAAATQSVSTGWQAYVIALKLGGAAVPRRLLLGVG